MSYAVTFSLGYLLGGTVAGLLIIVSLAGRRVRARLKKRH